MILNLLNVYIMKKNIHYLFLLLLFATACKKERTDDNEGEIADTTSVEGYEFVGGYPTQMTIQKVYDDADLNRAIQAYKFFYPTVSKAAICLGNKSQNATPLKFETTFKYWEILKEIIDQEPVNNEYRDYYGELAVLGIVKGVPLVPDNRIRGILKKAAKIANEQMRVQSFANRRNDRMVWNDRQWEWGRLRTEDNDFNTKNYIDLEARETWFYQTIGASSTNSKHTESPGSLYWLGLRDNKGKYVDGTKTYKLKIPLAVPTKLFWSVTVYDAETRCPIATDQNKAMLSSQFELKNKIGDKNIDLYFGPKQPKRESEQWIKTIPNKGWFVYFRIYEPEIAGFNGSWKPGDFEEIK